MANENEKKKKKTASKRVNKTSDSKPKSGKPAAKKSAPKSTAGKKPVKASASKSSTAKPAPKQTAKKTTAKKAAPKNGALKPDWGFENEKPKSARKKKEEIIINIPKKTAGQPKSSKNVTKQVTEQLPDNAKLKTIHLHFRID